MGKVVHIMTVGTSLLTNDGGLEKRPRNDKNRNVIGRLNKTCELAASLIDCNSNPTNEIITGIINDLKAICPSHEISLRGRGNGFDRLPQELSYLWIRKTTKLTNQPNQPEQPEEIHLLPSNTPHAGFCAEVIKEYINNYNDLKNYYCVVKDIRPVDGINPYDGERFKSEGIKNLFGIIYSLINEYSKKDYRIYLNITGGYKGVVPYSTLQGMLYPSEKVTICYLFEESPNIIEIPAYPVGVDFHLWHRNSTRLKMVCDYGIDAFRNNLDRKISPLLDGNQLNAFGKQLKESYQVQLEEQPLEIYTKEIVERLLPNELNGNVSKYREILNSLIDRAGVNIWTGDKVPEMVEHARRHHHNLLEFAEMFLTPIFCTNPKFMNAEERFCLIAGLLLHDCGHSLDYMKTDKYGNVPLFPGEIREYHQLLAVQRLEDPELARSIGWKTDGLNKKLHDAVMTVCKYHRRRMPFESGDFENPFRKCEEHPPLDSLEENYKQGGINIDIMKAVALMRIIDGCDNQAKRTGNEEDVDITLAILTKDYESACRRAKDAWEAYKYMTTVLSKAMPALKNGCNYIDATEMKLSEDYMGFRIKCLETLASMSSEEEKTLARLWLTAAELVDRADMKHKQKEHYLKHQCVRQVMVIPSINNNEDGNIKFDIVLYRNEKIANKYLKKKLKDGKTRKELIEREVASEYCEIEKYLAVNYSFRLKYWWDEEYEQRSNGGKPFYEYYG